MQVENRRENQWVECWSSLSSSVKYLGGKLDQYEAEGFPDVTLAYDQTRLKGAIGLNKDRMAPQNV